MRTPLVLELVLLYEVFLHDELLYDEVALSFGTFLGVSDIVSLHRLE